ncbi:MAG: two-component regulator propeller domain-containing protein, partial [Saprospiraceae bacterium]
MKLQIKILFFILLLWAVSSQCTWSQAPIVRKLGIPDRILTKKDGLISNNVYGALQDLDGFMWFYTDKGVSKYDGHHFKNFTLENGLPSQNVWLLTLDSKNRIWIHTHDNVLAYIKNDSIFKVHIFKNNLQFNLIQGDDNLIFDGYTLDFMLVPNGDTFLFKEIKIPITENPVLLKLVSYSYSIEEFIYSFAGIGEKMYVEDTCNHKFETFDLSSKGIFYSPLIKNNNVLVSSSEGLLTFNSGKLISNIIVNSKALINRTNSDFNGNIWVATKKEGVYFYISEKINVVKVANSFQYNFLKAFIYENKIYASDKVGNLYKINPIIMDLQKVSFSPGFREVDSWFNNKIIIYGDSKFSIQDQFAIKNHKITSYLHKLNKESGYIFPYRTIKISRDSIIGLDSRNYCKLYCKVKEELRVLLFHIDNFRINQLFVDSKKYIQIFSKDIMYTYDSKLHCESETSLFVNNEYLIVSAVIEDKFSGLPIIGTYGQGIYLLNKKKKWELIPKTKGLEVQSMSYCGKFLSVHSNKGIFLINTEKYPYNVCNAYTSSSGLIPEDMLASYAIDSFIYCVSKTFIAKIKPEEEKPSVNKVYITNIESNQRRLSIIDLKSLPPDFRNIKLSFSLLDYAKSEDVAYSYKLQESDNWTNLSTNEVLLSELSAGKYNLQILARNKYSDQIFGKEFILLQVNQVWWKKIWFILLVNLSLMFG